MKKSKWDKLNIEQRLYAESLGTNSGNMTDRQYQILTTEKSNMWSMYQWHFYSTEWNQPLTEKEEKELYGKGKED